MRATPGSLESGGCAETLHGWGYRSADGHGREGCTPHRAAALFGRCVKLVDARDFTSCAVTERGELFTWGASSYDFNIGHEVHTPRVAWLNGVKITAVAISRTSRPMQMAWCAPLVDARASTSTLRASRTVLLSRRPLRSPCCACAF